MVKIKEINIISFGKIENLNIELNDGLNVIYGTNEAGKSTVQAFIKAMFYGMGKKKKIDAFSDRMRFLPWSGNPMSGNLIIEYNGREIEVARRFGKTAAGDKISVTDKISGMVIDELNVSAPGEILFGMSAQMFEKTLWISQNSAYIGGADEEITSKLMNLTQTHNEDISHIKALDTLKEKKAALKAESKRNKNGVIDDIDLRSDELLNLKHQITIKKNEKLRLEYAKEKLLKEQEIKRQSLEMAEKAVQAENAMEKIHKADKLKEYLSCIETIKDSEDYVRFNNCDAIEPEKIEKLYSEKESVSVEISKYEVLEKSITDDADVSDAKRQFRNLNVVSGILFVFGIIMMFVYMPVCVAVTAISVVLFIIGIIKKRSYTERIERMQSQKVEYEEKLRYLKTQLDEINVKIDEIFKKRQVNNVFEYRAYYNKYVSLKAKLETLKTAFESLLDGEEYEKLILIANELRDSLKDINLTKYKTVNCEEIRQQMLLIAKQLSDIENKLNYEYSESLSIADIENELFLLEEKRKDAVLEHKAVEVAISGIEEAYLRLRTEFGPLLNENVNDMVRFLTDGKYSDFRVSDMYRMKINCMGETKEAEYLSTGTYEQIYLALRLSIAKLVSTDNIIMFLDDAFSTYDDVRSTKAVELIKNYAENSQVILLSCHMRDRECAEKLNGVNVVSLSENV